MTIILLSLLLAANAAEAAGVKLQNLRDFDSDIHHIAVNVQVGLEGGCVIDPVELTRVFTGLLNVFGFQTAPLNQSELEFAVSVKGIFVSANQPCGIKLLSMVRQIPTIKMLRLEPGSTSTEYRLWATEHILTAANSDIQSMLQQQALDDVVEFTRSLEQIH
jgi:hypothetical protein